MNTPPRHYKKDFLRTFPTNRMVPFPERKSCRDVYVDRRWHGLSVANALESFELVLRTFETFMPSPSQYAPFSIARACRLTCDSSLPLRGAK